MPARPHPIDWVGLVALTIMWGSAFALTRAAVEQLPPSTVVLGRLLVGALVLLAWWAWRGRDWPRGRRLWIFLVAIALLGNVIPFNLIAWGQQTIDSGLAGILMAVMPLFTLVLAHFAIPGERLSPPRLLGFVVGLVGVAMLLGPNAVTAGGAGSDVWAALAVLGGALCYAISAVLSRLRPASDVVSSAMATTLIGAGVMSVTLQPTAGVDLLARLSTTSLVAVALLGVFSTAIATVVYFRLIERVGPGFVSQLNYLIPVWAVVLGALLFGERPSPDDYIGMVIILIGIAVSQTPLPARRREADRPGGVAEQPEG